MNAICASETQETEEVKETKNRNLMRVRQTPDKSQTVEKTKG